MTTVIPMPLNKDGEGPEMDPNKVVETVWELWDDDCQTLSVHPTEVEALAALSNLEKSSS